MNASTRTAARLAATVVLVLAAASCRAPGRRIDNPFAAPGSRDYEGSIRVRVENMNFNDATIHAVRGGERIRLGQVTGKSDKDFTVRWNFSLPLEFEVHLIGGEGCGVRGMSVDPGDRIWLRIPAQVPGSQCYSGKG